MTHANNDTNRSLVRIFSICLSSLVFCYSTLALRLFLEHVTFDTVNLFMISVRVLLGVAALFVIFYPPWLARPLERQIDVMGSLFEAGFVNSSTKEKIRLIVLVTMVSLLLELVMIRWLASVFPVFSFFKNFTLLACFLGLGAGYAVAEKQPCAPALVLPMLALFVGVITLLRYDVGADQALFTALPMLEQTSVNIVMDRFDWLTLFRLSLPLYLLLAMSFVLCACICYPVGQLCGKLLHSSNALKAYGLNLVGSILGVVALFVMSLFWLPPVVWFTVVGGILLFFVLSRDARLPVGVASFCLLLTILSWPVQPETQRLYSPYQLLERTAKTDGLMQILSGGFYYQKVFNLAESNRGHEPDEDRYVRAYYEFPFNFKKKPERVAIVGSGSGNDVAAALRMGALHVDAIEIDPAIAYLGKIYHPEHPYDDPRVTLTINDARNFFRTTHQQYDLIIYGVLDSHTALSHASNLRVDSYVYTREGIAEAFKLLKPDGVLSIAFALPNESLGFKLSHILQDMPGAGKPLAVRVLYDSGTTTAFIAQKGRDVTMPDANVFAAIGFTNVSDHFAQPYPEASIPTDDWPFFYMIGRTYPVSYMIALGMALLLSYLFVRKTIGLTEPDRARLFAVFLPRLRLYAGGDQGHYRTGAAPRRHLVRRCGGHRFGFGHGVSRQPHRPAQGISAYGPRLSRTARQPARRICLCAQPRADRLEFAVGESDGELRAADYPVVFFGHCIFDSDRQGQGQHLHRARLQSDGGAVWWLDGIQLDVFRICISVFACDRILFPRMDVFLGRGGG